MAEMFSKAHYQLIADAINRELKRESFHEPMRRLIDDFCEVFIRDNPRFVRERFIDECWKGVL